MLSFTFLDPRFGTQKAIIHELTESGRSPQRRHRGEVGVMSLPKDTKGLRKTNSTTVTLEGRVQLAVGFYQPLWSFQA